jgi:hypothetical protein
VATGPGRYDDLCTYVRERSKGDGAVVMIFGGQHGNGFSVQVAKPLLENLPTLLREMADDMDADLVGGNLVEST